MAEPTISSPARDEKFFWRQRSLHPQTRQRAGLPCAKSSGAAGRCQPQLRQATSPPETTSTRLGRSHFGQQNVRATRSLCPGWKLAVVTMNGLSRWRCCWKRQYPSGRSGFGMDGCHTELDNPRSWI